MGAGAVTLEASYRDSHLRGDIRGVEQAGVCVYIHSRNYFSGTLSL